MRVRLSSGFCTLLLAAGFCSGALRAQDVVHAVAGAVTKVDSGAKTLAVKTADGSEDVFKYTAKTSVRGAKAAGSAAKTGAVDTYMAGKEGTHVIVRYVEKGSDKTAIGIKDFGKDTLKVSKGTVTRVDRASHTVAIKTEDGAEATFHISKDAAVDGEHGVVEGAKFTAKEGDKIVVHYSEDAGRKVVHFLKHI